MTVSPFLRAVFSGAAKREAEIAKNAPITPIVCLILHLETIFYLKKEINYII
jgi:hypothetical protein